MTPGSFLGLYTVVYAVAHLGHARDWYRQVLGKAPYFDEPFYVGFNVGGCELGLQPREGGPPAGPGGGVAYWGVPDIAAAWGRLLELGAEPAAAPVEVGGGIRLGTVTDPFGNLLGIIENPHFPNTAD